MKITTLLAATLATAAVALSSAHAAGVVFNTPVTYTEQVTYAAGVTYLAPVTYGPTAIALRAQQQAAATPVMLERVIVTPSRTYAESEWRVHLASKKTSPQLLPVRSERRVQSRGNDTLRILLPLQ